MFYEILDETMKLLGGFCLADYFPSLAWVHAFTGLKNRVDKNFEELDRFFDEMIQERIDEGSNPDHQDWGHVLLWLQKDPTYGTTFNTMNNIKAFLSVSLKHRILYEADIDISMFLSYVICFFTNGSDEQFDQIFNLIIIFDKQTISFQLVTLLESL